MKNVTMYSTPTCPYCKLVKEFFAKNNISYSEKDISTDEKSRNEMVQKSGQLGVPVIDIEGEIIVGFDEIKIAQALEIK